MGKHFKKSRMVRIIAVIVLIFLLIAVMLRGIREWAPDLIPMLQAGDRDGVEEVIRSFGSLEGFWFLAFVQFVQILSVFFPCTPIQLAAGAVFGMALGTLACHIGYVAANAAAFLLARRLKGTFDPVPGDDSRSRFLQNTRRPVLMIFFACLLPLLPNGLIPYFAARTRLTFCQFVPAVFFGSLPGILCWCAVGSTVLQGNYTAAAWLCGMLLAALLAAYLKKDWLMSLPERIRTRR